MKKQWPTPILWIGGIVLAGCTAMVITVMAGLILFVSLPADTYQEIQGSQWKALNIRLGKLKTQKDIYQVEQELTEYVLSDSYQDNPVPNYLLGSLYQIRGEFPKASVQYGQALDKAESTWLNTCKYQFLIEDLHAAMGVVQYELGALDQAEASLKKIDPDVLAEDFPLQKAIWDRIQEPGRGDFRLTLAKKLRSGLRVDEARNELKDAIELSIDPTMQQTAQSYLNLELPPAKPTLSPIARYYLLAGRAHAEDGEYEHARTFYENAILEAPGFSWSYLALGQLYQQQKKYTEAKQTLLKAVTLNPDYFNAYLTLGDVAMDEEHYDEAVSYYQTALKISDAHTPYNDRQMIANIKNQLGYAFEKTGQLSDARNYYNEVLTLATENSDDYYYATEALSRVERLVSQANLSL